MAPSYGIGPPGLAGVFHSAWVRSRGSISLTLVYVCVSFFVVIAFLDIFRLVGREQVFCALGLSYAGIFHYFRLHQILTAPLLHSDVFQLLFNMLAIWMLGPDVERTLGRRQYLILVALCLGCSMVGFLVFSWGTGNVILGCSGLVFGLLVIEALLFPNRIIVLMFFPMKMKHAAILLGLLELYLTVTPGVGGAAHLANLFGAVAAYVYLRRIQRQPILPQGAMRWWS